MALANEGGGLFLLGASDSPPRRVIGTTAFEDPVSLETWVFSKLNFQVSVHEVFHPDGRVLVFDIPSRPYGSAYHIDGQYLSRSGSSLVPMSPDKLRSIFNEARPDWLKENVRTGLSDAEVVDLLAISEYFDLKKMSLPEDRSGIIDRLFKDDLLQSDSQGLTISRLTAVLLAKDLGAFRDLEMKAPRVIVYNGEDKLNTRLERTGSRGYAIGLRPMVGFISEQMPQNEDISSVVRESHRLLPQEIVRELVANALVHQDFSSTGFNPRVEIYSNRIEISNAGEPLIDTARFIDVNKSRNDRLAFHMRQLGLCEEKGSGIDRVISQTEVSQLPPPQFRVRPNQTVVTVAGYRPFSDLTMPERISACYQHCALKYVLDEVMTNESLRDRFGLSADKSSSVSQVIRACVESGMIKPDESAGSSRRNARYVPSWA